MARPISSRPRPVAATGNAAVAPPPGADRFACSACGKTLGLWRGARLHVRFSRGHEYLVSPPVAATCRGCGTLTESR